MQCMFRVLAHKVEEVGTSVVKVGYIFKWVAFQTLSYAWTILIFCKTSC